MDSVKSKKCKKADITPEEKAKQKERKRLYNKTAYNKVKQRNEKAAQLQKQIISAIDREASDGDCLFGKCIMGFVNSESEQTKNLFNTYAKNIRTRLNVSALKWKTREHCKLPGTLVSANQWKIEFYVDVQGRHVKDQPRHNKKTIQTAGYKLFPWLEIKESSIAGAGLGLFALRDFEQGAIVGLYMGSFTKEGTSEHTVHGDFGNVHCHSFSDILSMGERHSVTMGMQMMNDPNWRGWDAEKNCANQDDTCYNITMSGDMIVWAKKKINRGDEIFMNYNITLYEESDDSDDDNTHNNPEDSNNDDADDSDYNNIEDASVSDDNCDQRLLKKKKTKASVKHKK